MIEYTNTSVSAHQIMNSRCFNIDKGRHHVPFARNDASKLSRWFSEYTSKSNQKSVWSRFNFPSINQRQPWPFTSLGSWESMSEGSSLSISLYPSNEFDVIENVQFHKRNRHFVYTFSHFITPSNRFSRLSVRWILIESMRMEDGEEHAIVWIFVIHSPFGELNESANWWITENVEVFSIGS